MEEIPQDLKLAVQNVSNPQLVKQCEQFIESFKKSNPNGLVSHLTKLLLCPDTLLRESTSVLIRTIVSPTAKDNVWDLLTAEVKRDLKATIMQGIKVETIAHVRHKLGNIITSVAPKLLEKREWPELVPFIIECTSSDNEHIREVGYLIIGSLASDILEAGGAINPELFKQLVQKGLSDPSLLVQISALGTIASFIEINTQFSDSFKTLLPSMLKTIDNAMQSGTQEKQARSGLVTLMIIVEIRSEWIKNSFEVIYNQLSQYMKSSMSEDETKHHCVEFFITVAEKKPSLIKHRKYLAPIVETLLQWVSDTEVDDEDDLAKWVAGQELDEDPTSNSAFAADVLERLSSHLGKAVFPILSQHLPRLVQSQNWKERLAALTTIAMVSSGCQDIIKSNLKDLISLIAGLTVDSHIRVRNAAFSCLDQLANDFGPKLHTHLNDLLPVALQAMNDPCPRVLSAACMFLSSFLEDISREKLMPSKDTLLKSLHVLIQYPKVYVAQSALNAFSTVIESIGEDFKPYYKDTMAFLIQILQVENVKENRNFRGRAIEAISLIGVAVGKEIFKDDCITIMKHLSSQPKFSPDDPQIDYSLRAFTRFCQALGEDFVPYLELAMKPLIEAITQGFEVKTQPLSDGYEQDIIDEDSNRTLENKALALYLIGIYAVELKGHLFSWVAPLLGPVSNLLAFVYNEEVRTNAANLVPLLLRITKDHFESQKQPADVVRKYVGEVFLKLFPELLKTTAQEEEQIEVLAAKVKNIGECLEIMGPISGEILENTVLTFKEVFASFKLYEDIIAEEVDHEDEDPEDHYDTETLNECFTDLAIAVGDFVIANKENAMPLMSQILPIIFSHIEKSNDDIRSSMICILIDIISNGGQPAYQLYSHIIPIFLQYAATSTNQASRQTSANGLGIAAAQCPELFAPYLEQALNSLNVIVSHPDCRKKDNLECTENAIAAIGKIVQHFHQSLSQFVNSIISTWITFIPVEDKDEFPATVTSYIAFLEYGYESSVFGSSGENIQTLFNIIVQGERKNCISEEQFKKLSILLKNLRSKVPFESFTQKYTDVEDQKIIMKYLS